MSTESRPTEVPNPVRYAYRLWLAVVAVGLVDAVVSEIADPTTVTADAIPAIVVYVIAVAVLLLVLALVVWFARAMHRGRNWARFALVVVLILMLPSSRDFAEPITGALDVVGLVLDVVSLVMAVAAVGMSFSPKALPYFRTAPATT